MKTSVVLTRIRDMLKDDATLDYVDEIKIVENQETIELEFLAETLITIAEITTTEIPTIAKNKNKNLHIAVSCYRVSPANMEDATLAMTDFKQDVMKAIDQKSLDGAVDDTQATEVGSNERIDFRDDASTTAYYALRSIIELTAIRYND